jgi:hypothetical protein
VYLAYQVLPFGRIRQRRIEAGTMACHAETERQSAARDQRDSRPPCDAFLNQFARIHEVLRLEMQAGPGAVFFELDSEEISYFPKDAISYRSPKLPVTVAHDDSGFCRNRLLNVETDARKRNVFEICDPAVMSSALLPKHFHQFRTQHPIIISSFLHTDSSDRERRPSRASGNRIHPSRTLQYGVSVGLNPEPSSRLIR